MKSALDAFRRRLASELNSDALFCDDERLAAHRVDGKQAHLLCLPEDKDQLGAILRLCAEAEAAVAPWGNGTAMALGNPPRQIDVVIATGRLNRVLDHDPANLTVTVECGLSLGRLQSLLSEERQFVPLDPPFPERSSLGGIVAAGLNGPRRNHYGGVRDLVIGMKVVLCSGEQIKAGGKVVKNVAGYDMCKLFVGSLGTLGIVAEVSLRLAPVPETATTVVASGTFVQARQFIQALTRSVLFPAAVFLSSEARPEHWAVAVCCEGFEETVARSTRELTEYSTHAGMRARILAGGEHSALWRSMQNFSLERDRVVFRITVPRGEIFDAIESLRNRHDGPIRSDILGGTIWLSCPATKIAVQHFFTLSMMARARRGHAIIFSAPTGLKRGTEVWGESPPSISLMRNIKQRFDPKALLNPGRFLAGI